MAGDTVHGLYQHGIAKFLARNDIICTSVMAGTVWRSGDTLVQLNANISYSLWK